LVVGHEAHQKVLRFSLYNWEGCAVAVFLDVPHQASHFLRVYPPEKTLNLFATDTNAFFVIFVPTLFLLQNVYNLRKQTGT
jgi:hypothetical protein